MSYQSIINSIINSDFVEGKVHLPAVAEPAALLMLAALFWAGNAGMAYFAVFPSILAYLCWNRRVQQVGANRAGLFLHLVPVFGIVLAIAFLGERLHLFHLAGAALIFTGITISSTGDPARATAVTENGACENLPYQLGQASQSQT